MRGASSYAEACARHVWRVPAEYNIALDACDQWADGAGRRALVWDGADGAGETWSFDDLKRASDRLAGGLASLGLGRGDRVALMLPQTPEHAIAHLAVFRLGAVSVPLSRLFGLDALRYRLEDSGARALLTDSDGAGKARAIREALPELRHVVRCDRPARPDDAGALAFADLLARGVDGFTPVRTRAEDPALLIYTSGTSGPPKGALHAHRYLLGYNGVDYANNFFRPGDLYWSPADWAWVGGLLVGLLCPLAHGVPVLASAARFDPAGALELMARFGVTNTLLSATALRKMAVQVGDPRRDRLRLRAILSGGERVTPEIARWVEERLGLRINEVYGQTEANILVGENEPLIPPRREPLGRPYPGHEVAIVDDGGRRLAPGEVGVIAVRRGDPVIMLGYWNRPDATAAAYRGEWFLTGDLGAEDPDGWIHYKGRADDVINSAGFRIGPAEVEGCLLEHPAVEQCAVVGVPDPTKGEAVRAFVLLAPGHAGSPALADELGAHVKARLGTFQRPRDVEWVDELPMTVSGKIRRAELRQRSLTTMTTHDPPAPPPSAWGRRLSDAIRAALETGDLTGARRLALEGDGQAKSLGTEYTLMVRGLGITLRVLLRLLGELPPREALPALLRRFRSDLAAVATRAFTAPEAHAAVDDLRRLAANTAATEAAAELVLTVRLVDGAEALFLAEQARLARDVLQALDAGDAARARALVDEKERAQYVPLHDRLIRFMAEVFGWVLERLGPDGLLRFHRAAAEGQRAGFEKWERMGPAEFARASAFLLKQHMGHVEVREDDEKFTIEQAPCGSGGRLRLAGAYAGPAALPVGEARGPLTAGEASLPVYCSHCPVWNGLAPLEWFGRPHWVFDRPSRPDGSCTLHIYKRRAGAPAAYAAALGVAGGSH
ncbi:MAG: AMP-binding protein [Candidatus Rokubacteria bacterium]|nr:AMP-binding protein [Candidatus Rokubacteria bacterium]